MKSGLHHFFEAQKGKKAERRKIDPFDETEARRTRHGVQRKNRMPAEPPRKPREAMLHSRTQARARG